MFSEPAVGEKFFGRDEVLELLNKRVSALKDGYRQNIALTGPSLAGKSSIILHFLHVVREEGFIPIYVEVVREPFSSFANKFIATMLYNSLAKTGVEISVDLDRLLAKAQEFLPKTSQAIRQVNSLIEDAELDEAYSALLALTSVLKEELGMPSIVILDEFDNLEHLGIKNPFMNFGKVIMVQKDTMYVVSSSRNAAIKKIISEKLSLLFGNFEVVKVSNFGFKVAGEFINTKLGGFEIEDFTRRFLIAFTDGNPFYLNKIICCAREMASERMTSFIDKAIMAEAILELVYNSNGTIHQYLLTYILDLLDTKSRDFFIAVLTAIAGGQNRQQEIARTIKGRQGEVSKALLRLVELGLVSKNGVFYRIDDMLLEFWLKSVYQRRKALLVDGTLDKMDLFRQDIGLYMEGFEKEFNMSVASRIAELFGLFSDELIQLDAKQIRLPHFTKVEVRLCADSKPYIAASFRGNFWIVQPYEYSISENEIIDYIRNIKSLSCKISNRIIIPLKGMDENSKLLAKELKISIWDGQAVNTFLKLYGKKRIVIP